VGRKIQGGVYDGEGHDMTSFEGGKEGIRGEI